MLKKLKSLGPAILVTSAFIGPGTVTICSIAGAKFGFSLLWAMLFSIFATIILQEMCARLGVITQKGLGQTLREQLTTPFLKWSGVILVVSAILIGNGAYEAGNISGAALGMTTVLSDGTGDHTLWVIAIGIIALVLLSSGSYRWIERTMIVLVLLMSIVFIVTAMVVAPPIGELLAGFVPSLPDQSTLLVIGLIGTTVVPYNLFLHSSAVTERWKGADDLPEAQLDTWASITIGGLISISIVITSAMAAMNTNGDISSVTDLAKQLEPLLGSWSKYFMGAGLFAAGISSSITAPLAAGYATSGILGIKSHPSDNRFKMISIAVLLVGIVASLTGFRPIEVIRFAQVANGLLLPVTAFFLIWIMNKSDLLGQYRNSKAQNVLGITIVVITVVLGLKSILTVIGIL